MKGVDALIATVFIIMISIVGIAIVLESSQPSVGRTQEISLMKEGKSILTQIDNAVRDVAQEGEGSTRVLRLSVSDGSYFIDVDKDEINFYMDSTSQIVGEGVYKTEGSVNIFGGKNSIYLKVSYTSINITNGGRFGKGYRTLTIRNDGYDLTNDKQIISISLVPAALPLTAFVNQYNQYGSPYIVKGGVTTGNYVDLNILGEGLTYNIPESKNFIYNQPTYYINFTENLQTQIGTTEKEALRLTWTAETNSRYLVIGYLEGNNSATTNQTVVRVKMNNLQQFNFTDRPLVANTEYIPFSFAQIYAGTGNSVTYNWTFASSSAGTAGIIRARLIAIRIDNMPNTNYNYSYNATEQANVDNIWGDDIGDTDEIRLTPNTDGFYLLWGSATVESDNTGSSVSMRMNIDNGQEYIPYLQGGEATWSYSRVEDTNTADEIGFYIFTVRKLTSSSTHSIKLQIADIDTTASSDWKYRSLIAIRLSDVFNFFNASTTTETSTISQSFQNYTVLNIPSENSGKYLAIGGISLRGSATNVDFEERFVVDDAVNALRAERSKDANDYLPNTHFYNFSIDDNPHYVATQYRRQDTSGTAYVKNSDILVLNLEPKPICEVDIWHNSSQIQNGNINFINATINFTTNESDYYSLQIYDWSNSQWNNCESRSVLADVPIKLWCNITFDPMSYNSSDMRIRIRINTTADRIFGLLKEDYVQYFVGYTA